MNRRSMLIALATVGIVSQFVLAKDSPKNNPAKQQQPLAPLKAGDLAPPLTVTKWLQGDALPSFERGKVYIVEFWATWCGSCIRSMPHLAELQTRYGHQGLTVIAFTSSQLGGSVSNSEEKVAAFIKKRGRKLGFRFAFADDSTTLDAWMRAGRGLPQSYLVDGSGRIAFIGNPMFLEMPLLNVLAGNASAKEVGDQMVKVVADYHALGPPFSRDPKAFLQSDPEVFFRALKEFETKYPLLADCLPAANVKLMLLLEHANPGAAKEVADKLLARAIAQRLMFQLEWLALLRENKNKDLVDVGVRAAAAMVRIDGGTDAYSLLRLAEAYRASGDRAKAKEYARKAIHASADESAADQVEIAKEAHRLGAD